MKNIGQQASNQPMRIFLFMIPLLLVGCSAPSVKVDQDFPKPLVRPLAMTMGVFYGDEFVNHRHEERKKIENRKRKKKTKGAEEKKSPEKYRIRYVVATGDSQVKLFDRVFNSMFAKTLRVQTLPASDPALDAIITPSIEDFQLSAPKDTSSNIFEVWIKYRMKLSSPEGETIASWPITAYGKTPYKGLSVEPALHRATVVALRDAGAHFVSTFKQVRAVKAWLKTPVPGSAE